MKRVATMLCTILAVLVGFTLRPIAPTAAVGPDEAAAVWAASNGLSLRRSEILTNTRNYAIHHFTGEHGCRLDVAPLGSADEVMNLLREIVSPDDWQQSRLLIVDVGTMPQSAIAIHARLLLSRLIRGRAPQPAMLIAPSACLTEAFLAEVSPWPAL